MGVVLHFCVDNVHSDSNVRYNVLCIKTIVGYVLEVDRSIFVATFVFNRIINTYRKGENEISTNAGAKPR